MSASMGLRLFVPLLAMLLMAAGLAACQEPAAKATQAGPPPRPVLVQRVAYEDSLPERSFVGTIRPRVETDHGFRVTGKVAVRLVNVGERVKAGQPLARLDEADLRLQAEQADADFRAAESNFKQAEADLKRTATLSGQGWVATASLDRQRTAMEEARGRVLRQERAVGLARNARSYALLAADADGVVTATMVEPGQVMAAGQAAFRIARTDEKEAVVAIPEALVGLADRARAGVTLWSAPDKRYAAKLREIAPAADAATRTYLAKFAMQDADGAAQLGMTATVTLAPEGASRVARLPLSALFNQGAGPVVWIVGPDGRPAMKPVTVAAYEAREVLVSAGLQDGDEVVTLGVSKLDAGQRVRIVEALQF